MNIWKHVRIGGSVISITGALVGNLSATLIGFMVIIMAVIGSADRSEYRIDELEKKLYGEDSNEEN